MDEGNGSGAKFLENARLVAAHSRLWWRKVGHVRSSTFIHVTERSMAFTWVGRGTVCLDFCVHVTGTTSLVIRARS